MCLRYYKLLLIGSTGRKSIWSLNTLNNPTSSDPPIPTHILYQKCMVMSLVLNLVRSIFSLEYKWVYLHTPITHPIFQTVYTDYFKDRIGDMLSQPKLSKYSIWDMHLDNLNRNNPRHIWDPVVHTASKLCRISYVYVSQVIVFSCITSNSLL